MNTRIDKKLVAEYKSTDAHEAHEAYDEMLDGCYSFESVGWPFKHFRPSKVLEKLDPICYRDGYNDWLDGERDRYYEASDGELYTAKDVNGAADEVDYEINEELEALEEQIAEEVMLGEASDAVRIGELKAKIEALNEELDDVEDSRL